MSANANHDASSLQTAGVADPVHTYATVGALAHCTPVAAGRVIALEIRQEIPIRSFSISAYLVKVERGRGRYLILRRVSTYLHGSWQQVSGRIERGETGWQAALREIREETGLAPAHFYSANEIELFYEQWQNCINLVPVFVGFLEGDPEVVLSPTEHDAFRWISAEEAPEFLASGTQIATIERLEAKFVQHNPSDFLRVHT